MCGPHQLARRSSSIPLPRLHPNERSRQHPLSQIEMGDAGGRVAVLVALLGGAFGWEAVAGLHVGGQAGCDVHLYLPLPIIIQPIYQTPQLPSARAWPPSGSRAASQVRGPAWLCVRMYDRGTQSTRESGRQRPPLPPTPPTYQPINPPQHTHINVHTVVGIDLGTTFSVAAVNEHGRVRVINDTGGDPLVPSIVSFLPRVGR